MEAYRKPGAGGAPQRRGPPEKLPLDVTVLYGWHPWRRPCAIRSAGTGG